MATPRALLATLGGGLLAVLLLPALLDPPAENRARRDDVAAVGAQLVEAISSYRAAVGDLPSGGNTAVMAALRGGNPGKQIFFDCSPEALNERGELLDPWGTPYRLSFDQKAQRPKVHSAGPNRIFESEHAKRSDDYRSWRLPR